MTLSVTNLHNDEFLIKGTDSEGTDGRTVLKSPAWAAVLHLRTHKLASGEFDELVRGIFAPLTDGVDAIKAKYNLGEDDEYDTEVIEPGVEGVEGKAVPLDENAKLLKMIEKGKTDFIWVGERLVAIR